MDLVCGCLGHSSLLTCHCPLCVACDRRGCVSGRCNGCHFYRTTGHEQSLGLDGKEARAHCLVVSGTLLGFMASGATSVVRGAATAAAGTVPEA